MLRGLAYVIAAFAAGFPFQLNPLDGDGFVERLGHVVDGECGDGGGSKGFHFDASVGCGGGGGGDGDARICHRGDYVNEGERERVTHGDELRCALRGLDAGDAGYFEGIAFGVFGQGFQDFFRECDEGGGGGFAVGGGFGADVDHVGAT